MKINFFSIVCLVALTFSPIISANNISDEHHAYPNLTVMFDSPIDASGVIKSIGDGSISIHHDAIPAIRWSSMIMPFKVSNNELSNNLKVGDRIDFQFIRKNGKNIIIKINRK